MSTSSLRSLVAPLLLLTLCTISTKASAGGAEAERWRTLVSEHFRLHYHTGTAEIADDVAIMLEEAHELLSPLFGFEPQRRTHVVLVDEGDSANGSAGVFPYAVINLLAAPPESSGTRNDTDNWMWELIVHEYVHILHIGQIHGPIRALNWPFGRWFMPNAYFPRWFTEGVATSLESELTAGGRNRNSTYAMYRRTALLNGTLPTLGQLTGDPPDYPYARGWYLFGASLMGWVAEGVGWDAIFQSFEWSARRLIPFRINYFALENYGRTFDELYEQWQEIHTEEAAAELEDIRAAGVTEFELVTNGGHESRWVQTPIDDPASVVWLDNGPRDDAMIRTEGSETSVRLRSSRDFAVEPGGRSIIIPQTSATAGHYRFKDLWRIDIETGRRERMTTGARASDPAVHPRGDRVVYSAIRNGGRVLVELDLASDSERVIFDGGPWTLAEQPEFLPDGSGLLFSLSEQGMGRDIMLLEERTGELRRITNDRAIDDYPTSDPAGAWVYFTSDRDGIFDVYAWERATGDVVRVTRVETGVFGPRLVRDSTTGGCWLYASVYTASGYDIARTPMANDCSPLRELPAPEPYERPEPRLPDLSENPDARDIRYRTAALARPRTWSLRSWDLEGGTRLALSTDGVDPAGRFGWNLTFDLPFDDGQPRFGLSMTFRQLYPTISVGVSRFFETATCATRVDRECFPLERVRWTLRGTVSVPFQSYRAGHNLSLGYSLSRSRPWGSRQIPPAELDPATRPPSFYEDQRNDSASLNYSGSTSRSFVQSLSTERGWSWSAGVAMRSRIWGAASEYFGGGASVTRYSPLGRDDSKQVLAVTGSFGGGWTGDSGLSESTMGGFTEEDVFSVLTEEIYLPSRTVRGYDGGVRRGQYYWRVNAEYRFPIYRFDYGHSTLPFFFREIYGVLFVDSGNAFDSFLHASNTLLGVGGELRLKVLAGYVEGRGLRFGVARGLGEDGRFQWYVGFGSGF